ncbi:MAG: GntR family transcriptional regulator [Chitinivibrionales bacterium]|nr:GntR family transcriptional regulator [Chitinivibrionales bacterium]
MSQKYPPGVKKSLLLILSELISHSTAPGETLPLCSSLAEKAGVSYNTMCKALAILKSKGILDGGRGRRSRLCHNASGAAGILYDELSMAGEPEPDTAYKWNITERKLRGDILNGKYSSGISLPSLKELENIYGVSFRTIKKALLSLSGEGLIRCDRKGYAISRFTVTGPRARIVLLSHGHPKGGIRLRDDYLKAFELACFQANVELGVNGIGLENERLLVTDSKGNPCNLHKSESTLGYVMVIYTFRDVEYALRELVHFQKPVAILDFGGGFELPSYARRRDIRVFTAITDSTPGLVMARFLRESGHKNIAYISPFHESAWSKRRLAGIRQIYGSAGKVAAYIINNPGEIHEYFQQRAHEQCDPQSLIDFFHSWKAGIPPGFGRILMPVFDHEIPNILVPRAYFYRLLDGLFESAAKNRKATAWFCANDEVALAACEFCRNKGISIPDRLSIVGCDNTDLSLRGGLTTYDFNIPAVFNRLIQFVANPWGIRKNSCYTAIKTQGIVVKRFTAFH